MTQATGSSWPSLWLVIRACRARQGGERCHLRQKTPRIKNYNVIYWSTVHVKRVVQHVRVHRTSTRTNACTSTRTNTCAGTSARIWLYEYTYEHMYKYAYKCMYQCTSSCVRLQAQTKYILFVGLGPIYSEIKMFTIIKLQCSHVKRWVLSFIWISHYLFGTVLIWTQLAKISNNNHSGILIGRHQGHTHNYLPQNTLAYIYIEYSKYLSSQ